MFRSASVCGALFFSVLTACSAASPSASSGSSSDAVVEAPDCLGASVPLVMSNGLPYATARVNDVTNGMYLVDLATTRSTIDLAAFDIRPTATNCDPSQLDQSCTFDSFSVFGDWGQVSLLTEDLSSTHGTVREAGILGTDFLSVVAVTLDYGKSVAHYATSDSFCSDDTLSGAGFVSLDTSGYFASDLSTLLPAAANVPTVPVKVAGTSGVAQLDTGFDDSLVPFSVNVNEAFFDAANAANPGALVRASSLDLTLSTCVGINEPVEAYTLAPGATFDIGTAGSWTSAIIFVKKTPAAAQSCGGIGTWTTPAAQIGASFFADLGTLVFDPFHSRVWARAKH